MAEKRMFSLSVCDTDWFLDLPLSTQALYFHLALRADDDGFVDSPKSILRKTGASANDYDLLVAKRYILKFESGVIVIKHWRMHNTVQRDRYHATQFQSELSTLELKDNKSYTEKKQCQPSDNQVTTECIQNVSNLDTTCKQNVSSGLGLGLDIGLDKGLGLDNNNILSVATNEMLPWSDEAVLIFNLWNECGIIHHNALTPEIEKTINKAVALYGVDAVGNAIKHYYIVYKDTNYFFSYKWKLVDFLKRSTAMPEFFDNGAKWQNYINSKEGKKAQEQSQLNELYERMKGKWFE